MIAEEDLKEISPFLFFVDINSPNSNDPPPLEASKAFVDITIDDFWLLIKYVRSLDLCDTNVCRTYLFVMSEDKQGICSMIPEYQGILIGQIEERRWFNSYRKPLVCERVRI